MPPPESAVLPEMVELETKRVPRLLNAPPLPPRLLNARPLPEIFAPETVTPEMERLPPEAMEKMLKLRVALLGVVGSLPLIISEEEPGPLMVRVPKLVALAMTGKDDASVIVPAPPVKSDESNTIVSAAAEALAVVMASRSVVKASVVVLSASESTMIVAGVILFSRLRSSSRGEPEVLRAFLFWELIKSLRKAFKNIGGVL